MSSWDNPDGLHEDRIDSLASEASRPNSQQLTEPIRVRASEGSIRGLDRIEAFVASHGHIRVNRSAFIRLAIDRLIADVNEAFPDVQRITLPDER